MRLFLDDFLKIFPWKIKSQGLLRNAVWINKFFIFPEENMGCCSSTASKYKSPRSQTSDAKANDLIKIEAHNLHELKSPSVQPILVEARNGKPFLLRKCVRLLTLEEKNEYIRGVKALKKEMGPNNKSTYDLYIDYHIYASTPRGSNKEIPPVAHGGPAFLPWHRLYILMFERDMQRVLKNSSFALHYWD